VSILTEKDERTLAGNGQENDTARFADERLDSTLDEFDVFVIPITTNACNET
jgi:hypothetical protein